MRENIYALLNKVLYGTVQASLLFWMRLSAFLVEKHGFKCNPYDYCVVNKVIDKKQCTIVWYVDNLKVSHVDDNVVGGILELIKDKFGKDLDVTVTHSKVHDYLGIQTDFSKNGKVVMLMFGYIDELLKEYPEDLLSSGAAAM
jgi:Reverse transcriptase (RNA-dependent DNA polymerase)